MLTGAGTGAETETGTGAGAGGGEGVHGGGKFWALIVERVASYKIYYYPIKYYLEKLHVQVQEQEQQEQEQEQEQGQGLVHNVLMALTVEEQQIVVGD